MHLAATPSPDRPTDRLPTFTPSLNNTRTAATAASAVFFHARNSQRERRLVFVTMSSDRFLSLDSISGGRLRSKFVRPRRICGGERPDHPLFIRGKCQVFVGDSLCFSRTDLIGRPDWSCSERRLLGPVVDAIAVI